jgi:hypothetical protein
MVVVRYTHELLLLLLQLPPNMHVFLGSAE